MLTFDAMPVFASSEALSSNSTNSILGKSLDKLLKNSRNSTLEENLKSAHHSSLLNCSLKFKVSEDKSNSSLSNLSQRYQTLKRNNDKTANQNNRNNSSIHKKEHDDGIPLPKIIIGRSGDIKLTWCQLHPVGSGLKNLGNSCFMNSVLQCLTYLPPLYNAIVDKDHANNCSFKGFCSLCEVQKHIWRTIKYSGSVISPTFFFNNLNKIGNFVKFKQEDAHEFLRYLLSHMEKCALEDFKTKNSISVDAASSRTTVINNIFGGYNRSQVVCLKCKETSNTFDPFLDIMLDIKHTDTLEGAIAKYIQSEVLDGDNSYQCQKCKCRVRAQKRVTLHRTPPVCTFHLKRFQFHNAFGSKIGKWIRFPEKLNLRPYMSDTKGPPVMYILRGLVIHLGHSMQSGHYCSYIRSSKGNFYCMNDDSVSSVDKNKVFSQNAYILFYTKIPQVQKLNETVKMNGNSGTNSATLNNGVQPHKKPQDISTKLQSFNRIPEKNSKEDSKQPRLVIKIKNGHLNGPQDKVIQNKSNGLVPYAEDSGNESDIDPKSIVNKNIKEKVEKQESPNKIKEKAEKDVSLKLLSNERLMNCVTHDEEPAKNSTQNKIAEEKKLMPPNLNTALPTLPLFKKVRRLSGCLLQSVSQSPCRLNASGNWSVTENKNQEPSVASSSSSATSFNSTVDNWTVTGHDTGNPSSDKRSFLGWTVENSPQRNEATVNVACNVQEIAKNIAERTNGSVIDDEIKLKPKIIINNEKSDDSKQKNISDGSVSANHVKLETQKKPSPPRNVSEATAKSRNKHQSGDSDDSYEVEWVEKTKETIEKEREGQKNGHTKTNGDEEDKHSSYSQYTKKYQNNDNRGDHHDKHRYNNSRFELTSGSLHGYGPSVKSWNGHTSDINLEIEREQRLKRWATDDYDNEYDKGRTKKIKRDHFNDKSYKFTKSFQSAYDYQQKNKNCFQQYDYNGGYDRNKYHNDRYENNHHSRNNSYHGKSRSQAHSNNFRRPSFYSSNSHRVGNNR